MDAIPSVISSKRHILASIFVHCCSQNDLLLLHIYKVRIIVNKRMKWKNRHVTLSDYVRRRNGAPLGASGSLQNMLYRSFGAGTFAKFWQYWNPIWGYALGRYVYAPMHRYIPASLALILTFTVSGAIHDLATILVRASPAFLFTP